MENKILSYCSLYSILSCFVKMCACLSCHCVHIQTYELQDELKISASTPLAQQYVPLCLANIPWECEIELCFRRVMIKEVLQRCAQTVFS